MRTPFIIAEAGSCHEEHYQRAHDLVMLAKHCDADAVKFQYWSSPQRMRERRHVDAPAAYERGSIAGGWLEPLSCHAHEVGLEFMCTAYLLEDIEIVAPFVDRFKVSSFEARDSNFTEAHFKYGKQVIVSTGMYDHGVPVLVGSLTGGMRTLHCVSAYPAPLAEANLSAVRYCHGYSDHTRCIYTGGFVVSAGADVLEVHYRLDDTSEQCADYPVALSPGGLAAYITLARLAAVMRGDGVKRVQPSEQVNLKHRVQS